MSKNKRISLDEDINSYRYKEHKRLNKKKFIAFLISFLISGIVAYIHTYLKNVVPQYGSITEYGIIPFIIGYIIAFIFIELYFYLIIYIGFIIIELMRKDNTKKYHSNRIYCVDLLSVSRNIVIDPDLDLDENIQNSKWIKVDQILVQETYHDDYYREIVSGMLIPRASIITYIDEDIKNEQDDNIEKEYLDFDSPVFTLYEATVTGKKDFIVESVSHRRRVTHNEVKDYVSNRIGSYKGFTSFSLYLKNIFEVGDKYCDKKTPEQKIAKLLKELR